MYLNFLNLAPLSGPSGEPFRSSEESFELSNFQKLSLCTLSTRVECFLPPVLTLQST